MMAYSDDSEDEQQLDPKVQQEIERRRQANRKKNEQKRKKRHLDVPVPVAAEPVKDDEPEVEVEYVSENLEIPKDDPNFSHFTNIMNKFKLLTEDEIKHEEIQRAIKIEHGNGDSNSRAVISERILQEEMDEKRKEESGESQALSRRKLRLQMQPSIAELKSHTARADVVEWADVTSRDPHLLVQLKSYRNTVPVPRHWNAKRKYLAGKRGFERPPFELPEYIKRTGITEMRETMWEKEDNQTLKSKMRERMRPKLGRIDIDYQKLHDAFFKWQTKPVMTRMGELYYEGKEMETQMKDKKPGVLSDELRIALGMPVGTTANKFPPPWLIAMQRYGPPPSYPNLKIPGLNCPIPEGCSFGYHAGGWGKPPVDEYGKPLYGDVFGLELPQANEPEDETQIDRRHWGEIDSEEEESEEESDIDEDEEQEPPPPAHEPAGYATPAPSEGLTTPAISTIPGIDTPSEIELRKSRVAESLSGHETPAGPLYTILPEKKVDRLGKDIMASTHVYDLSKKVPGSSDGVEVSLNPEDLDLGDQKGLEEKYEEQLRKQTKARPVDEEEDFTDMVADHNRRKRKADQKKTTTTEKKKYKDFKF